MQADIETNEERATPPQCRVCGYNHEPDCDSEIEPCEFCGGTGEVEEMEHVTGNNIMPGGFWEGSGRFRKCKACNPPFEE